jgi:hypothetical protein
MTPRRLSFIRWASLGQAALAFYLIAASFFLVGLQGRHREGYSMFASRDTNEVVADIAREAAKASEWTEISGLRMMLAGIILLLLSIAQFISNRPARTQTPAR